MFLNELNDEMNIQRGSEMNESLRYYLENFEIRDMYCEAYGICESDYEDDDDDEYDEDDIDNGADPEDMGVSKKDALLEKNKKKC